MRVLTLVFCLLVAGPASALSFADNDHVTLGPGVSDFLLVSDKAHIVIDGATILGLTIQDKAKVWFESGDLQGPIRIEDQGKLFLPPGFDLTPLQLLLDDDGKVLGGHLIPEPVTATLFGLGLLGLGWVRWS